LNDLIIGDASVATTARASNARRRDSTSMVTIFGQETHPQARFWLPQRAATPSRPLWSRFAGAKRAMIDLLRKG
jgi:hypothetical protein